MGMTMMEMLMSRETLLNDIEFTVDAELDGIVSPELRYELIRRLADKVCKSFPGGWVFLLIDATPHPSYNKDSIKGET